MSDSAGELAERVHLRFHELPLHALEFLLVLAYATDRPAPIFNDSK